MRNQTSILKNSIPIPIVLFFCTLCVGQGTAAPPQAPAASEGPAPLRVMVGKSLLINTTDRLKRVSVTDPDIADPQVITPTQVLVHGRSPGGATLVTSAGSNGVRSFLLRVIAAV